MENETHEEVVTQVEQKSSLHQVTPLSKYLALALFIILPFLGGWIGYTYAPEKVVEVEKVRVQTELISDAPTEVSLVDAVAKIESSDASWPTIALEYSHNGGSETAPWSTNGFSFPDDIVTTGSAFEECGFSGEKWNIGEVYAGVKYIGFTCSDEYRASFYFEGEFEISGEVNARHAYGAGGWLQEDVVTLERLQSLNIPVDLLNIQSLDLASIVMLHSHGYPERIDGKLVDVTASVDVITDRFKYTATLDCSSGECFGEDGEPYSTHFLTFPVKAYSITSLEAMQL